MAGEDLIAGRYQKVRLLGRGGVGVVHEAEDTRLGRRVAVKVLSSLGGLSRDDELLSRFLREARALARIDHPGVVTLYDEGVHEGAPFLVMQLLDGLDLARLVSGHGPLPSEVACGVALGMAHALGAAHEAGVLHRDVKPTNVGVTGDGRVVLHDFGLARLVGESALTKLTAMVGTPQFMAPEIIRGARPGPTADLYGLGACLYLMMTGQVPFHDAVEVGAIVERAVGAGVPKLRHRDDLPYPEKLRALVDLLCSQDPAVRPRTAAEVEASLAPLVGDGRSALRELVAGQVRDTALQQVFDDPAFGDAAAGEPEYDWDAASAVPAPRGVERDPFRPLTLSNTTRWMVLSSMTPRNAASRLREAVTLVQRGELQEAVQMLSAITQVCLSSLGPGHPTTLAGQYWQAVCLARLGAGGEALELFSRVHTHIDHTQDDHTRDGRTRIGRTRIDRTHIDQGRDGEHA
ncbi:serine/threonine-protein kinase [Streptomyces sp. NPDC102274]|uniref:serine/threonine-protein kinase n=1 Tax=Streptomyces sp. NPDC102274 TaxID=3366151 RepID=UPI00380F4007